MTAVTTLVTGFEPFLGGKENTSELVVNALAKTRQASGVFEVLPTSFERAGRRIEELLLAHRPALALLFGLAATDSAVRLEQLARNRDTSSSADNDGAARAGNEVVVGGPALLRGSLPLERLLALTTQAGIEAKLSRDAGGYVCNHVYYRALWLIRERSLPTLCGFIHLPVAATPARLAQLVQLGRRILAESARAEAPT
jgi:pyroglutamyl-peptidase